MKLINHRVKKMLENDFSRIEHVTTYFFSSKRVQ